MDLYNVDLALLFLNISQISDIFPMFPVGQLDTDSQHSNNIYMVPMFVNIHIIIPNNAYIFHKVEYLFNRSLIEVM
jgi:hypothetical protein